FPFLSSKFIKGYSFNQAGYMDPPLRVQMVFFLLGNSFFIIILCPTRQHSVVSQFVSTFKRFCNKEYGKSIWQRHFHDHIIRNREDYEEHLKYIYKNPTNWHLDELYMED
ncbi:MAG: hypothetical protein IJ039_07560, partial [Clostridia bacterium]|nr:hypothetical protein [Clostridia bacterium]